MADSILVKGSGGSIFTLDLPLHEAMADQLTKGLLIRVDSDGKKIEGDLGDGVPSLPTERPATKANKAEWVGWAVAQGMDADEANGHTKGDLIERYATD